MKNLSYLIFAVVLLMKLVACNSVGRKYERLAGSRITFTNSLQRVEGCDTMQYTPKVSNPKMLIYLTHLRSVRLPFRPRRFCSVCVAVRYCGKCGYLYHQRVQRLQDDIVATRHAPLSQGI